MNNLNTRMQQAIDDIDRQLDENGQFRAMDELFMPSWWIGEREAEKALPYRVALGYMLRHGLIVTERHYRTQGFTVFVRGEE